MGTCHTFHLLLQCETAMNPLQLGLHREPTDVRLQVCAVHHADPEHYQGDMLGFCCHQATLPLCLCHTVIVLFILKHHFTGWLCWAPNAFMSKQKHTSLDMKTVKWKDTGTLPYFSFLPFPDQLSSPFPLPNWLLKYFHIFPWPHWKQSLTAGVCGSARAPCTRLER